MIDMTRGMRTRGLTFSSLSLLGAGLTGCLLASCLVTDQIEYERPNTPPQVIKEEPLGFRSVPPFGDPECSPGTSDRSPWMSFPARLRDVDVDDVLRVRIIVDGERVKASNIKPNGKPERDFPPFCLERFRLKKPCLHVEMVVSREFANPDGETDPYSPDEPNDLGYAEWWVLGLTDFPEVGIGSCGPMNGGET